MCDMLIIIKKVQLDTYIICKQMNPAIMLNANASMVTLRSLKDNTSDAANRLKKNIHTYKLVKTNKHLPKKEISFYRHVKSTAKI